MSQTPRSRAAHQRHLAHLAFSVSKDHIVWPAAAHKKRTEWREYTDHG